MLQIRIHRGINGFIYDTFVGQLYMVFMIGGVQLIDMPPSLEYTPPMHRKIRHQYVTNIA